MAPVTVFSGLATREWACDGVTVPAGARVALMYASANRDERKWEDKDAQVLDVSPGDVPESRSPSAAPLKSRTESGRWRTSAKASPAVGNRQTAMICHCSSAAPLYVNWLMLAPSAVEPPSTLSDSPLSRLVR